MRRLAIALVAFVGCGPSLSQYSTAPPGRVADLDEISGFWGNVEHYDLEISAGVALTVTCLDNGPCQKLEVTSEDASIADVRIGSLAKLQSFGPFHEERRQAASFVIIGKSPGKTKLRVRVKDGKRTVKVTVVEPRGR